MRALLCVLLLGCTTHRVRPSVTLAERRAEILETDIAWAFDSVPLLKFDPPYVYGSWRLEVEQCSGKHRDGWPAFYVAPTQPVGPHGYIAFYEPENTLIVFGLGSEATKWIVAHELLHFLLNAKGGEDGHPDEYFGSGARCHALVSPT